MARSSQISAPLPSQSAVLAAIDCPQPYPLRWKTDWQTIVAPISSQQIGERFGDEQAEAAWRLLIAWGRSLRLPEPGRQRGLPLNAVVTIQAELERIVRLAAPVVDRQSRRLLAADDRLSLAITLWQDLEVYLLALYRLGQATAPRGQEVQRVCEEAAVRVGESLASCDSSSRLALAMEWAVLDHERMACDPHLEPGLRRLKSVVRYAQISRRREAFSRKSP